MFSWNEEAKEFYYKKVQEIIDQKIPEGKGRILVDRSSFGVKDGEYALVYIQALSVAQNKKLVKKILKLDGFSEAKTELNGVHHVRGCFLRGKIKVELRPEDK